MHSVLHQNVIGLWKKELGTNFCHSQILLGYDVFICL